MKRLLVAVIFTLLAQSLFAAGSVVVTSTTLGSGISQYTVAWTSDASGAVSGNLLTVRRGRVVQVKFRPGSGGTQPTDLYDATLVDPDSVDLALGNGANLSNATSKLSTQTPGPYFNGEGRLDLVIANAGNAKTGTVIFLVGP